MHIKYDQVWENFLRHNYFPTYLRDIREIEFSEIQSCVLNDESKTSDLILDLLAGDLLIIKNVLSLFSQNIVSVVIINNNPRF